MRTLGASEERLLDKLNDLNNHVWRKGGLTRPQILDWVTAVCSTAPGIEDAPELALSLLSQFCYFSPELVRELLRAMHRRFLLQRWVRTAREAQSYESLGEVEAAVESARQRTRWFPLGGMAKSGNSLLYPYRSVNGIPPKLFPEPREFLESTEFEDAVTAGTLDHLVFFDDFCGTGRTVVRESQVVPSLFREKCVRLGRPVTISCFLLVGFVDGLERARKLTCFDEVSSVLELDRSFSVFSDESRYFTLEEPERKERTRLLVERASHQLPKLRFAECGLMVGFELSTPNNTLPIFWSTGSAEKPWPAPFPRIGVT